MHPFENRNPRSIRWLFWGFFLSTIVLSVLLGRIGAGYESITAEDGTSYDVIAFEFAKTQDSLQAMFALWGEEGMAAARLQTIVDYLFPFAYANTIALAIIAVMTGAGFVGIGRFIGLFLAWGQWMAGLLDIVENSMLLTALSGNTSDAVPLIAYYSAAVKFFFVIAGILYVLFLLPWSHRSLPKSGALRHPLERLATPSFVLLYMALFVSNFGVYGIIQNVTGDIGSYVDVEGNAFGGFHMEVAKTPERAEHILTTWGEAGRRIETFGTALGYLWLLCYTNLIAGGLLSIASAGGFSGMRLKLMRVFAWSAYAAGLFDAIENTCILLQLNGTTGTPLPQIAYYCALPKFTFILAGVLGIFSLVIWCYRGLDEPTGKRAR